jgi:hypothetical protein
MNGVDDSRAFKRLLRKRYHVKIAVSSYENVIDLWVATPFGELKAVALAALHVSWTRPGGRIEHVAVAAVESGIATTSEFELVDPWVKLEPDAG